MSSCSDFLEYKVWIPAPFGASYHRSESAMLKRVKALIADGIDPTSIYVYETRRKVSIQIKKLKVSIQTKLEVVVK